jgi:hypothetical protein
LSLRNTPQTVWEFPTSIAKSMIRMSNRDKEISKKDLRSAVKKQ